ncbi:MAG: glycosyltransferase family 2 protein [Ferruginibacter sp.]
MELSIIIVNYNVKYFLEQCLHSVQRACSNIQAEIFVVDNNSIDGSKEYLTERFPFVKFRWLEINVGFARANNSVISETHGDHILFLNPDTILPEDCLEKCIDFLTSTKKCGALGVHMIDGCGKFLRESKRSLPTPLASFFKMGGFASLFPSSKLFSQYYAGHLHEHQTNEVDIVAGAFMMLNRACLNNAKGFDEDYFMYGEDIDLSYRIQKAGYVNYYFADTSIIHFKGESTHRATARYVELFYAAMKLFIAKHYKQNRASYLLMKFGIFGSSFLAHIKTGWKNVSGHYHEHSSMMHVAVIAEQHRFEEMIRLMKHSVRPMIFKGRISPGNTGKGIHIGTMENIPQLIKKFELSELVFCEGALSFKCIIEQVKKIKGPGFLFHAEGSTSVVGSSKKNEKGIIIAKR